MLGTGLMAGLLASMVPPPSLGMPKLRNSEGGAASASSGAASSALRVMLGNPLSTASLADDCPAVNTSVDSSHHH